jgi:hypothetical protein
VLALLLPGIAQAQTTVTNTITFDLNNLVGSNFDGTYVLYQNSASPVAVTPFTVKAGDTVVTAVNFLPGQTLTLDSGGYSSAYGSNFQVLLAGYSYYGAPTSATTQTTAIALYTPTGTVNIGDLGYDTSLQGEVGGEVIGANNITSSSITLTGFKMTTTIETVGTSQATESQFVLDAVAGGISLQGTAPEPSTWALLLGGLAAVFVFYRRRRGRGTALLAALVLVVPAAARAQVWSGGAGNTYESWSDWSNGANWNGGQAPSSAGNVSFGSGLTTSQIYIDSNSSVQSITFGSNINTSLDLVNGYAPLYGNTGGETLTLTGGGLSNQSTSTSSYIFNEGGSYYSSFGVHYSAGSSIIFNNSASSGNVSIYNSSGQNNNGYGYGGGASITFNSSSNAGSSYIDNYGAGYSDPSSNASITFNNNSSASSSFIVNSGGSGSGAAGAYTFFENSATAGSATIYNQGGSGTNAGGGHTDFYSTSTAGSATFYANAGSSGGYGGYMNFNDSSSAGTSTITNNGGAVAFNSSSTAAQSTLKASAGTIYFEGSSSGGTARLVGQGGAFDISAETGSGISVGSIEGSGNLNLGSKNLAFGSLNTTTSVSAVIADGGASGGTGGSITKQGTGTTTLTAANSYTGGTTVSSGALLLGNGTNGSATGTGSLTVAAGATIGGVGTSNSSKFSINGNVIVGNGTDVTSQMTLTATLASTITGANLVFNLGSGVTKGESNVLNLGATPVTFSNTTLKLNLQGASIIPADTAYTLITTSGPINAAAYGLTVGANGQITGGLSISGTGGFGTGFTGGFLASPNTSASSDFSGAGYTGGFYNGSYLFISGDNIDVMVVPEPSTWALLLGGLVIFVVLGRSGARAPGRRGHVG